MALSAFCRDQFTSPTKMVEKLVTKAIPPRYIRHARRLLAEEKAEVLRDHGKKAVTPPKRYVARRLPRTRK